MKKALIISPYFPPSNAADMHRIRMSLPYFNEFGWEVEIVTVKEIHSDMVKDLLLKETLPNNVKIHEVDAFSKKITSKIGLGSIALRSLWFYKKYVNKLLKNNKYDLIYFSTTQFPICILGVYWKKKYNIPYVIDMQDPWHSDYYRNKPKAERPKKYWFSYRLNKFLEPIAMKHVDGLISVSEDYIVNLKNRYAQLSTIPSAVITFGYFESDFKIAERNDIDAFAFNKNAYAIVYVGVVGKIMAKSLHLIFKSLSELKRNKSTWIAQFHFYFVGTSYAPKGKAMTSVMPIASQYGMEASVTEQTDRIGFFNALKTIKNADALLIIGSDDKSYTASKIYPYILSKKNILAIFSSESNSAKLFKRIDAGVIINIDEKHETAKKLIENFLEDVAQSKTKTIDWEYFKNYAAAVLTKKQCELFNKVLANA